MPSKWYIVDIKMIFWDEKEGKRLSQELPFYNKFIPHIKHLKTYICCMNSILLKKHQNHLEDMQKVLE